MKCGSYFVTENQKCWCWRSDVLNKERSVTRLEAEDSGPRFAHILQTKINKKHKLPSKMLKFQGKRKALFTETEGAAQLWHKRLFCGVSVGFRHSSSPHLSILLFRKQNHLQRPRSVKKTVSDSENVWDRFDFRVPLKQWRDSRLFWRSRLFYDLHFKQRRKQGKWAKREGENRKVSSLSLFLWARGSAAHSSYWPATALKRFSVWSVFKAGSLLKKRPNSNQN